MIQSHQVAAERPARGADSGPQVLRARPRDCRWERTRHLRANRAHPASRIRPATKPVVHAAGPGNSRPLLAGKPFLHAGADVGHVAARPVRHNHVRSPRHLATAGSPAATVTADTGGTERRPLSAAPPLPFTTTGAYRECTTKRLATLARRRLDPQPIVGQRTPVLCSVRSILHEVH